LNKDEATEEVWEGKIKAINTKVDSGFSNMEKDILQKIRKEVRHEIEDVKKQVGGLKDQIGGIKEDVKKQIGGIKEDVKKEISDVKESLKLIMQHMKIPSPTN